MGLPVDYSAQLTKPGQANLAGDEYAMMIERFTGEVLFRMQNQSVTEGLFQWTPLVGTDTLSNAAMGDPQLLRLEAGKTPNASKIEVGSQIVQVRKPIIARVAIGVLDNIQDRLNVKGRTPERMGKVIAKVTDQVLLHQAVKSAMKTTGASEVTGLSAGTKIVMTALTDELDAVKYEIKMRALLVALMDKENEPTEGLFFMEPRIWSNLFEHEKLISSLYTGAGNDFGAVSLSKAAGFPIRPTVRLSKTAVDDSTVGSNPYLFGADYAVTAEEARVVGLYAKPDCIMIAEALPITTEIWWDEGSKTHVLDAYFAFGAGPNNPAEAGVILSKAP